MRNTPGTFQKRRETKKPKIHREISTPRKTDQTTSTHSTYRLSLFPLSIVSVYLSTVYLSTVYLSTVYLSTVSIFLFMQFHQFYCLFPDPGKYKTNTPGSFTFRDKKKNGPREVNPGNQYFKTTNNKTYKTRKRVKSDFHQPKSPNHRLDRSDQPCLNQRLRHLRFGLSWTMLFQTPSR